MDTHAWGLQVYRFAQRGRAADLGAFLKAFNLLADEEEEEEEEVKTDANVAKSIEKEAVTNETEEPTHKEAWLRLACLAAIRNDHAAAVAMLVELPQVRINAPFSANRGFRTTLACYAASFAGPEVVRLVVRPQTLNLRLHRPLAKATYYRNDAATHALLDAGADVQYGMYDGVVRGGPFLALSSMPPLHKKTPDRNYGNRHVRRDRLVRLDRLVQKLVAAKVQLHKNDIWYHVTKQGRGDVVRVLHRAKACVDGGLLFHACRHAVRSTSTLMQHQTSLKMSRRVDTICALLRCKVHVDAPDTDAQYTEHSEAEAQDTEHSEADVQGAAIQNTTTSTTTALNMAVENGAASLVAVLLAFKASVNIPNKSGELPIDTAFRNCIKNGPATDFTMVHRLLDAKADATAETRRIAEATFVAVRAVHLRLQTDASEQNEETRTQQLNP